VLNGPFLDTSHYSATEIAWYVGGFLAWVPAYVAIIVIAVRERRLEIPVLAATGNITWELVWGFGYQVDMGWGVQVVYQGAFLIDALILFSVFRYGAAHAREPRVRAVFPVLVVALLAGWAALVVSLRESEFDLPLGSVSAYLVNLAESGVYLWFGLTRAARTMSFTVAWSKLLGTGMVTVFVFQRYDQPFVRTLAVLVGVLDGLYLVVLARGRSTERPAGEALSAAR
jgi:hypothetical protein